MSALIKVLEPHVANKIAAGEVVERPSAVVKELVENAIDAGATAIFVDIQSGGKKLIRVTDNGCGIGPEDMLTAFLRHATSKVSEIEDIYSLSTLGFRGEALASIAAVSQIEMTSKRSELELGTKVVLSGGSVLENVQVGAQTGTSIVVKELFFNTPARLKFMKSTAAETSAISDLMTRLALSHMNIQFTYQVDHKVIFKTAGDGDAKKVIYAVLDKDFAKSMVPIEICEGDWKVTGYLSKLSHTKGNRSAQIFFVNKRYIKSRTLLDAVSGAYLGQLPVGRFPSAVLYLEMPSHCVDVNIHPAKTEVKFQNELALRDFLTVDLRKALRQIDQVPEIAEIKHSYKAPEAMKISEELKPSEELKSLEKLKMPEELKALEEEKSKDFVHSGVMNPAVEAGIHTADEATCEAVSEIVSEAVNKAVDTKASTADINSEPAPNHRGQALYKAQKYSEPEKAAKFPSKEALSKLNMSDLIKPKDYEMPSAVYEQTSVLKTSDDLYEDLLYVGQIFNSYLLFQKQGKLYVIDQHAGHEKILYETFKKTFNEAKAVSQILAKPIVIELSHSEFLKMMEKVTDLEQVGFIYEAFGDQAIVIREVPLSFHSPATEAFFRQMIDELDNPAAKAESVWRERLILAACKAAIKANDRMEAFEVKALVSQLRTLNDPYTCPHGRPIIVAITQAEFEKMFKRT